LEIKNGAGHRTGVPEGRRMRKINKNNTLS
jgi:hypothetical protein